MENNGYNIVLSELVQDENGIYRMDYDDMERKLRKTEFTLQYSARLTILPVVYGNSGNSKKPWLYLKNTMYM